MSKDERDATALAVQMMVFMLPKVTNICMQSS